MHFIYPSCKQNNIMKDLICRLLSIILLIRFSKASSSSSSRAPDWLSHIDDETIDKYKEFAEERHNEAIQSALENYPVDELYLKEETLKKNQRILNGLRFHKFKIKASGFLPDYHEELGDAPVFVTRKETPLFSKEECEEVIQMAESFYEDQVWPKLPSGQYYIQGFWLKDVPSVGKWFTEMCKARLFPLLQQQFPDFVDNIDDLVVDQAYLFKYKAEPGLRTEIHTDAGCLSFTFALNPKEEYTGGGTWVEGLESVDEDDACDGGETIEMDMGQCTVRPGGIRHCGNPLQKGVRYIIGGFCMSKKRIETVRQLLATSNNKEGLEVAIKLNPKFDGVYPSVAHHYENEGKLEKSIQILEDCLKLANPISSTASYYLGTIYYKREQWEKAKICMDTCLTVDKNDGDALGTLAQIMAKQGRHEEEYDLYKTIAGTAGVSKRILSNAYCNLGTMQESNIPMEIEYYRKALENDPSNVAALQSMGSAYASLKDWKIAVDHYRRSAELDRDNYEVLTLLYRAAAQQLRTETKSSPQSREAMMERLGEIMGISNMNRLLTLKN